eukprot:m.203547 g.203547  ORF g.203547 m.203547 type:complete len:60 (-) comp13731_c3_seq1:525-704(-)
MNTKETMETFFKNIYGRANTRYFFSTTSGTNEGGGRKAPATSRPSSTRKLYVEHACRVS